MRRRAGFTLMELLTVLAVLSVVSTIGISLFFRINDEWRGTTLRLDLNSIAGRAFDRMERDFGHLASAKLSGAVLAGEQRSQDIPLQPRGMGKERERAFQRTEDDRIILPIEQINAETQRMERLNVMYQIDRSGVAPALTRTLGASDQMPPAGAKETIAEGVLAMRIEYDAGAGWQPNWSQAALPETVRVSLIVMSPDRPWEQLARKQVFSIHVK